jgi:hypothetical protein
MSPAWLVVRLVNILPSWLATYSSNRSLLAIRFNTEIGSAHQVSGRGLAARWHCRGARPGRDPRLGFLPSSKSWVSSPLRVSSATSMTYVNASPASRHRHR